MSDPNKDGYSCEFKMSESSEVASDELRSMHNELQDKLRAEIISLVSNPKLPTKIKSHLEKVIKESADKGN